MRGVLLRRVYFRIVIPAIQVSYVYILVRRKIWKWCNLRPMQPTVLKVSYIQPGLAYNRSMTLLIIFSQVKLSMVA